jgi:hypothetical protein
MDSRWKYVLSSTIPLAISAAVAAGINGLPYGKELGRTLVVVSGSTVANRIITVLITPDVNGWKHTKGRYARQVSLSTGVGVASSLIGSAYDRADSAKGSLNLAIAAVGSWAVGNLTWLGDALALGEELRLGSNDLLPPIYV